MTEQRRLSCPCCAQEHHRAVALVCAREWYHFAAPCFRVYAGCLDPVEEGRDNYGFIASLRVAATITTPPRLVMQQLVKLRDKAVGLCFIACAEPPTHLEASLAAAVRSHRMAKCNAPPGAVGARL